VDGGEGDRLRPPPRVGAVREEPVDEAIAEPAGREERLAQRPAAT
jgi:hypothetical protein